MFIFLGGIYDKERTIATILFEKRNQRTAKAAIGIGVGSNIMHSKNNGVANGERDIG